MRLDTCMRQNGAAYELDHHAIWLKFLTCHARYSAYTMAWQFMKWSRAVLTSKYKHAIPANEDAGHLTCSANETTEINPRLSQAKISQHYTFCRELNRNDNVVVTIAMDSCTQKTVVLKTYTCGQQIGDEKMVQNEITFLQRCTHPNIVRYIGSHTEESWEETLSPDVDLVQQARIYCCIVLENADGGNLRQWLAGRKTTTACEVFDIVDQIMSALAHCHHCGVAHRDIKPENLVLFRDECHTCGYIIKLCDFGHSKFMHQDNKNTFGVGSKCCNFFSHSRCVPELLSACVSTADQYKSPEICGIVYGTSDIADEEMHTYDLLSADLWSLGCLIFEVATLKAPFGCAPDAAFSVHGAELRLHRQTVPRIQTIAPYDECAQSLCEILNSTTENWTGGSTKLRNAGTNIIANVLQDSKWANLKREFYHQYPHKRGPAGVSKVVEGVHNIDHAKCSEEDHLILKPMCSAIHEHIGALEDKVQTIYNRAELDEIDMIVSTLLIRKYTAIRDGGDIASIQGDMTNKITELIVKWAATSRSVEQTKHIDNACQLGILKSVLFPRHVMAWLEMLQ